MAMWRFCEVHDITEMKDGCVFKTKVAKTGWFSVPEVKQLEKDHYYVGVVDHFFGKDRPVNDH